MTTTERPTTTEAVTVARPDSVTVATTHGILSGALAILKATQIGRAPVPTLTAVQFHVVDGDVIASSFDYETLTQVRVGVALPGDGAAPLLVQRATLTDFTASLVKGSTKAKTANLPVTLTNSDTIATLAADGYEFTLPTLPADDHPRYPDLTDVRSILVDRDVLNTAVVKAAGSVGKDDTLPMLTGYHLAVEGEQLTIATTDRFRLGVAPVPVYGDEFTVLAPGNLPAIVKHLPAGDVLISVGDGYIRFNSGNVTITVRLLDVEFVKYRSLIPADVSTHITIATAKLTTAITRVATVADRGNHVILTIEDGTVVVSAGSDVSKAKSPALLAVSTIENGPHGSAPWRQGFNPTYLLDALKLFGDSVSIAFTTPNRPALFAESVDALGSSESFRHLLMPARLAG